MAQVTVITNNKGGVSKTTTAVNLAAALRVRGFDVLCIDLDGQRNLTDTFGVENPDVRRTAFAALRAKDAPYVEPTRVRPAEGKGVGVLDVLPATRDMWALEILLSTEPDRLTRFGDVVDKYRIHYDVILIDTTPSMGLLSISALYAADNAIIPTNPDFLASRGLVALNTTVQQINENRKTPIDYGVLLCKYDKRKGLHRYTVEQVREAFPTFNTLIRDNVALSEAPAANTDIFSFSPRSYGAQDYAAFADEFVTAHHIRHVNHKY